MQQGTQPSSEPPASASQILGMDEADDEPPSLVAHHALSLPALDSAPLSPLPARSRRPASAISVIRYFRKKFYPHVTAIQWNDWRWQVANRIRTGDQLKLMLQLSHEEIEALEHDAVKLPVSITPYYMSLIPPDEAGHPLRRAVIPTVRELVTTQGEEDDPLGEEAQSPAPGLVHRYPDRVLLLVHDFCSTYCRYCTRSRVVGHGALHLTRSRLEKALDYIRTTPTIRDVLLSGGDPLVLNDDRLEWLLRELRSIPHVEIIRIGTKVPAVLPQRITRGLVRMLKRYHPVWMSLHFMHPQECTPETARACAMLADAGIPLGSQTVLLQDINDDVDTMRQLMHNLMKMRVRPYYLYQCDPISGSSHFRTSVDKGLDIIAGLRGHTSGYAVPTYVIDAPGGGGKIPIVANGVTCRDAQGLVLRNYEGKQYRYPDAH